MDESVEEKSAPTDCCVGCLTKDKDKLSNADATGLLKDFLNRELTHLFKHIPAILCTECVTQMESHINYKICVENSIAELEKDLPTPVKGKRGRPKKGSSQKKTNGVYVKTGIPRGRPKKTVSPTVSVSDDENEDEDDDEDEDEVESVSEESVEQENRGRKRKNLVYDIESSDSDEWDPNGKMKPTGSGGKRGRPSKAARAKARGRPRKNIVLKKLVILPSSGKKRGRPKKAVSDKEDDAPLVPKKKRGRPPKKHEESADEDDEDEEQTDDESVKTGDSNE